MLAAYEHVIENSSNMSKTDPNGIITFVNKEFCETTGYKKEELLGKTHSVLNHPENSIEKFEKMWDTITSKKIYNGIIKNLTKSGKTIYLKTTIYPILDENDKIIQYVSTRYDMTKEIELEIENARQNLKVVESERQLKEAQRVANLGSWSMDLATKKIQWSQQVFSIFEIQKEGFDTSFDAYLELIHPEDRQKVQDVIETSIKEHMPYNITHRLLMKDGRIKWVEEQGQSFYDEKGKAISCLGVIQDITQRYLHEKKIQEQEQLLFQQSKMAVMGEMLENIAHQWRQPLSVMSTVSSALRLKQQMNMVKKEHILDYTDSIEQSTQYLSQTIDDFRNYFKATNSVLLCDLNQTFEKVFKLLQLKKSVEVHQNIEQNKMLINENELVQVLMNLINNARDEFVRKSIRKKLLFIHAYEKSGRMVISIKDNAGGIPSEILESIFEPYFTTKEDEGTGLGLYMCKELINKNSSGQIHVNNVKYEHEGIQYQGAEFLMQWDV